MILQWFATADATELGKRLAQTYLDSTQEDGRKTKKQQKKTSSTLLKKMATQVSDFKNSHKLNFYKKAKVANAFKWALLDAGYSHAEVDVITHDLILLMR